MKLTIQTLKKLIREEMQRIDEGAVTIAFLLAYRQYLEGKANKARSSNLPVKQGDRKKKRIVTAVLFLHVFGTIVGHLMEQMIPDEMSSASLEDRAISEFYKMDPSEAQSVIDQLDMGSFSVDEILSIDEGELMNILKEYDPIGYYQRSA